MSGISEVDIKDWLDKCDQADREIDRCDRYPYVTGNLILSIRDYFQSQQKQVAALFKKPEEHS